MARPFYSSDHYAARLGRALDYIDAHLAFALRLQVLAAQASFSAFHFHRVFCEWQGETPQSYIRRKRLERSAALLHYGPDTCIMDIAPQCGFGSAEAFHRAFRAYFGMTPNQWRSGGYSDWSVRSAPIPVIPTDLSGKDVHIRRLPAQQVVYHRKLGPYAENQNELWAHLAEQVAPFMTNDHVCFAVGLDDPAVTPAARCRFDACIALPPSAVVPAHTPVKIIHGGQYAVLPYSGPADGSEGHWLWLLQIWLPKSGYKVSEHPCIERYPEGIPTRDHVNSELCLPLVR